MAQRLQALDQWPMRKDRVDGEDKLRLDMVCDAGRPGSHRDRAFDEAARVLGQRFPRRRQARS